MGPTNAESSSVRVTQPTAAPTRNIDSYQGAKTAAAQTSLSKGAIAGIVVACIVVGLGIGFLLSYVLAPPSSTSSSSSQSAAGTEASETSAETPESTTGAAESSAAPDASAASSSASDDILEETAKNVAAETSSYHVVTDDFEFDIPEYWRDKVDYYIDSNDEGMSKVVVYPITPLTQASGNDLDRPLITVEAVTADSPSARNAGDIVAHVACKVEGGDKTVVVHSRNWALERAYFFASKSNYAGSSQENELYVALVDLSSGGTYSLSDAREMASQTSDMAEIDKAFSGADLDFLEENLNSSIVVR